jgi:DMSO/TMAO reductase YedYZ heme-binding membrane subunit
MLVLKPKFLPVYILKTKGKKNVFSIILAILIFLLLFNYCVSKHLEKLKKLKKYKNKGKIQK